MEIVKSRKVCNPFYGFVCSFLRIFMFNIKFYILTKLFKIVCLINALLNIEMPNVTSSYGRLFDFIAFWTVSMFEIISLLIKLLQNFWNVNKHSSKISSWCHVLKAGF